MTVKKGQCTLPIYSSHSSSRPIHAVVAIDLSHLRNCIFGLISPNILPTLVLCTGGGHLSSILMEVSAESSLVPQHQSPHQSNPPTMPVSSEPNSSPFVSQVRKMLFRRMLVGVNDGRFFVGAFHCIDKQGNVILQDAVEYRSTHRSLPSPMEQRCLGLILIPASCRSSCHVDCSLEEQLSLLSLKK